MTKSRLKSSGERPERFVKLLHSMTQSLTWRDLNCFARAGYIEMARRYGGPGSNNSSIPYSVREIAENLEVSQSTAIRVFRDLKEHGFIVEMKRGRYGKKRNFASEWRLTEFACDLTKELPTKDYLRWIGGEPRSKLSTLDFVNRARAQPKTADVA